MNFSKRGCSMAILVATVLIALGGFLVYRYISSRVDFGPTISPGGQIELDLPPGFQSTVFADGLDQPRFIAFDPNGSLLVAERGQSRITSLHDRDQDGRAEDIQSFAEGLSGVHSLVYHAEAWYTAVPTGVIRLEDLNGDGWAEDIAVIVQDVPGSGQHRTRTVDFLPDGRMVLSVGSSCNVCDEEDPRRASILIYDGPSGEGERIYASGLRNAVGLAIHPETGELWATNNGRDLLGDNVPPDTIHVIYENADYGWPGCHAGEVVDPDYGTSQGCDGVEQPKVLIQAHSAPLGLVFYSSDAFPAEYQGDLFVALHGSWNRSEPTGYKVIRIPINDGKVTGPAIDFASGWLDDQANSAFGRPVGLAVGLDGALYVSDDKGGFIYRIHYSGEDM
jgi:glucose/arabinose dehydrogenase